VRQQEQWRQDTVAREKGRKRCREGQGWGWRADWFEERVHEWTQVIESFKVALFYERILVV
jgi:hypothetical protein